MKKETIEWTPEEKAEIERKEKRLKEALPLFWAALIPTYFTMQTLDRLTSIIFGTGITYTNVPPYFPIFVQFSSAFGLLWFMFVYYYWIGGEKRNAVLFYLFITLLQSAIVISGEMASGALFAMGVNPWKWYIVELPLLQLCLYGPGLLIAVAKRIKRRAVTVAVTAAVTIFCITFFAIVHWVFWLPKYPDFTWKGVQGPVEPGNLFLSYTTVLGPIAIGVVTAMQLSERVRMGIVTHEMKERKAKERKRKKKERKGK